MLFVHLGRDTLWISDGNRHQSFDRFGLDGVLPGVLVSWYREFPFDKIYVVNGPAGFTNLRVGSLAINLLVSLAQKDKRDLELWNCSKLDLYAFWVAQKVLPSLGYIGLGQKHSVWKYNFIHSSFETVSLDLVKENSGFLDWMEQAYWQNDFSMLSRDIVGEELVLMFQGKKHTYKLVDLPFKKVDKILPYYGIDPVLVS